MSISRQEEILSALWCIAALLAFGFEYETWGWVFAVKATTDTMCAIYFGIKEGKPK